MAKKNKKSSDFNNNNNNSYSATIQQPTIVSSDELAVYSDGDIRSRVELMESEMARAAKLGVDTYLWQVELAYLQREYDIRRARAAAHDRYLRTNPEASVNSNSFEEQLPN